MSILLLIITILLSTQSLFSQAKLFLDIEQISKIDTIYPADYERYITIHNIGDSNLIISDLGSSCNCTSLSLDSYTVPANDSTKLYVSLNHGTDIGDKQYHIYFGTNDADNSWNDLKINLFVKTDLISIPERLPAYTNIKSGSTLTYTIKLKNIGENDIMLKNPVYDDKSLFKIVSFLPKNRIIPKDSEKEFKLKIKVLSKNYIFSKITIPTNSRQIPKLEYTILVTNSD